MLISLCLIFIINIWCPLIEVFVPEFTGMAGTYQKQEAIDCTAEAECHSVKSLMGLNLQLGCENCVMLIKMFF